MISKNIKILLVLLLFALTLRLIHISDKAQGTDENHSIKNSEIIIEKGLDSVKDFGNPPGFYYFSGIILKLFDSVLILKLTMILIGLTSIFVTYVLVSKILNEKIALVAAFLLAINPMHVLLSQHIRVYILLMLVYITSTWLLYNFIKNKNKINLYLLPISYAIAIYLHYFSSIFILSHLIIIFLSKNKNLIKKYLILLIIVTILCLPLIPYFLKQYSYMITQENLTTIDKLSLNKVYYIAYPIYKFSSMMDISSTLSKTQYLIITAPIVFLAFIFGIFRLYKENKEKTLFIALNLILPIITLALIGFFFPVYSFRYLTYLLPFYIVPIASLIKYKKKGLILLAIISILWIIILLQYYSIVTIKGWPIHFAI